MRVLWVFVLLAALASACIPVATTPVVPERPTVTPLPAQAFITSADPISLDNVTRVQSLGRLDQPDSPTTVMDIAFAPDSTRLAALTNTQLVVWDLVDGRVIYGTSRSEATQLYFSPDKTELYGITPDGGVIIFDANTGGLRDRLQGHTIYQGSAAFSEDFGWLALGGRDGLIKVWDPLERTSLSSFLADDRAVMLLAFAPDGERLAAVSDDGRVRLWDWRGQTILNEWSLGGTAAGQLVFAPDGGTLAVGLLDGVIVWPVDAPDSLYRFELAAPGAAHQLSFSPDGRILTGGSGAAGVHLWSMDDGTVLSVLPDVEGERVTARFSPDGDLLATSVLGSAPSLWNVANLGGDVISRADLPLTARTLIDLRWTADGRLLLFIDANGPIYVWGVPSAPAGG